MDRFDPFVKYADVYGDIINWEKDPMNKPQNQNKYFFSDGKTYYEQICKMLRLMSVFKEAFNQIYNNEDEISEAWENFVNNLSASVVEGSEPDVTLTWTDDSVNFEFTMVPGVPGEQGVGITSISFNSDYTMTITLSDGNTYTSMSLKGETGPQGPKGETGSGLQILDVYATLADLQSAHPTGDPGDAYQVGSAENYTLYIWSSSQSTWIPAGSLGTVSPSVTVPLMDGTASIGSLTTYAKADHRHPTDTSRASQEELDALIKTSQTLIDQSFTYRESPAIQDGLARFDKIKGNTLVWNQLANISDRSFTDRGITVTTANGKISYSGTTTAGSSPYIDVTNSFIDLSKIIAGHKYLISIHDSADEGGWNRRTYIVINNPYTEIPGSSQTASRTIIFAPNATPTYVLIRIAIGKEEGVNLNGNASVVIVDLTQMGLDITDPSDFTSLFPLPFYEFEQGKLLSFNGTGLKSASEDTSKKDTLELPVATYFPTGMKSAGNAYDELTESKAITRIGSRAYQSGDESDTSVITDGTTTYYALVTPTETDVDLDLSFNAYENGTEQLLPVNGSVPSTSPILADMTYLSIDDAMEYIIDKLTNVPLNTQQILDALEDDVADLQTDVGALQPAVSALQTSVGNINTNIGQISSTVAGHTSSISDIQSDIADLNTGLGDLEDTVKDHTTRIGTLETGLSTTNGNVQSLSSKVQSIDGRVTNLESDLLIVVKKEYDYDTVAGNTDFGVQTPLSQEPGYKIIGIVGSEVQQGEHTSANSWFIVTQAHVHYTSTGGAVLSMMARNISEYTKTNVRVYLYLLCIKDTQSQ